MEANRKAVVEKLERFRQAAAELDEVWKESQDMEVKQAFYRSVSYPFAKSLEQMAQDIARWTHAAEKMIYQNIGDSNDASEENFVLILNTEAEPERQFNGTPVKIQGLANSVSDVVEGEAPLWAVLLPNGETEVFFSDEFLRVPKT